MKAKEPRHRIFGMQSAKIYSALVHKAERKGRTRKEVDQIICWLTGYTAAGLRKHVKGDEVPDPLMRRVCQLGKLIDELAQGKAMEKILRQ